MGLLGVCVALAVDGAGAATISWTTGSHVEAYTESGSDTVFPPTPPTGGAAYSFSGAASAASTAYDAADPDAGIEISIRHTHDPSGSYGPFPVVACEPFCAGSTAVLRFQTVSPIGYTISGAYSVVDEYGREVSFSAHLRDLTAASELFGYSESSTGLPNTSFGFGPAAGILIAGREYELTLAADLSSNLSALGLASASGFVELSFTPVPEPGTAALAGLGLAGWIAARRRRRR
jgi:hypothetical protein